MRRITAAAVALATAGALTTTVLGSVGTAAAHPSDRAGKPRHVDFGLNGAGFGSTTTGGQVPSASDRTAFMSIGCTTRVPVDRENHEAEVTIPGLGKASDVRTDIWTRRVDGVVSSYARNTLNRLVIAQSGLGRIELRAIAAFTHASHDDRGFHADAETSVGSIRFVPPGGAPQDLGLPTPGQPVEVPGLATISLGLTNKSVNADGARARANALVITKTASGTRSSVAHAKAQVLAGVQHGTFHGSSFGSRSRAADDTITSGPTPLTLMPCQGTGGEVLGKAASRSDLDGNAVATGLKSEAMGKALRNRSVAFERGSVNHVTLGGDQLVIDGVVGRANVTRSGHELTRSIKGSMVGTVTASGQEQEFPDTGVLEIPGVARLERFVTEKLKNGISVVALRITLLDGTGGVIDLGGATATIRAH
jgi:hypothetical protein